MTWKISTNLFIISKQVMQQHRRIHATTRTGQVQQQVAQFRQLTLLFLLTKSMNCRTSADLPTVPALFVNASLMSVRGIDFVTKLLSKLNCATHPDTKQT